MMKNWRYFLKSPETYSTCIFEMRQCFFWSINIALQLLCINCPWSRQNCDHIQSAISYTSASLLNHSSYLVSIWTVHCLAYSFPIEHLKRLLTFFRPETWNFQADSLSRTFPPAAFPYLPYFSLLR